MPKMREPRDPQVTGDTVGPNSPNRIDPMFGDKYRDPCGDTAGPGDRAGRKDHRPIAPPWPVK